MQNFITGVRGEGDKKQIRVYAQGDPLPLWTWNPREAEDLMSKEERKEFSGVLKYIRKWEGVTELKWADGGKKIAAILGGAAVLIDYPSKALVRHQPQGC